MDSARNIGQLFKLLALLSAFSGVAGVLTAALSDSGAMVAASLLLLGFWAVIALVLWSVGNVCSLGAELFVRLVQSADRS
jgi:hypothetical protein